MLKNRKKEALDAPVNLKLLVTIVEREKTSLYLDTLEGFDVNLQTVNIIIDMQNKIKGNQQIKIEKKDGYR